MEVGVGGLRAENKTGPPYVGPNPDTGIQRRWSPSTACLLEDESVQRTFKVLPLHPVGSRFSRSAGHVWRKPTLEKSPFRQGGDFSPAAVKEPQATPPQPKVQIDLLDEGAVIVTLSCTDI